jgi:hypothetical protein
MIEDPVLDLMIEVTQHDPESLTVSWSDDRTGEDRNVANVGVVPGPFGRVDWLLYDPTLVDVPFAVVPSEIGGASLGQKVIGLVSWHHDGEADVVLISEGRAVGPRRRRRPAPADPHELELVAALADRVETGSFLGDLETAGLVVRIVVDRLGAPLGRLVLEGGSFRWEEGR